MVTLRLRSGSRLDSVTLWQWFTLRDCSFGQYSASVLQAHQAHYSGWVHSWDEWVMSGWCGGKGEGGGVLKSSVDSPDGRIPDPQATRQVEMFEAPAVLGHLLHGLVCDVSVDCQRQRLQLDTLSHQVADGVILELAAGGEVDRLQRPAVVGQAAQGQVVHPLAVRQAQVLQVRAAQGQGHQGVAAQADAASQVHSLQVLVLTDDWQQLLVCHPVGALLQREALENFVGLQHGAKRLFGDLWPSLPIRKQQTVNFTSRRPFSWHFSWTKVWQPHSSQLWKSLC